MCAISFFFFFFLNHCFLRVYTPNAAVGLKTGY